MMPRRLHVIRLLLVGTLPWGGSGKCSLLYFAEGVTGAPPDCRYHNHVAGLDEYRR
jgi:hypothetical protein